MNVQSPGYSGPLSIEVLLEQLADLLAERIAQHVNPHTRADAHRDAGDSPWMSADTAARYLDWPKQRLYNLTAQGAIPHYKHDGRLLFHREELDTWLQGFAHGGGQ